MDEIPQPSDRDALAMAEERNAIENAPEQMLRAQAEWDRIAFQMDDRFDETLEPSDEVRY